MSDTVRYDDRTPRLFFLAAIFWAVVGMLVGVLAAAMLFLPELNLAPYFTFGRLRPLHTNAVIFAFVGNMIFGGTYHSMQRLLKARLFSDALSKIHFWGWQLLIAAGAVALVAGVTQAKEYAELPWVLDVVITFLWVVFAVNFFGTIARRREEHLYVAIWFYIATIVAVAILHIGNSMAIPYSWLGSYSAYAGVKDALMQWWYGHNAVAFFLTTPYLGLMYYYLPKAAERPVFSYKLSIMHFWSLVFVYIWAGPHHLHYTALPEWASTLGMLFSLILWMPSWGGMVNGLLTLRGAWNKLRDDPVLKFLVVAVTYYGMSTFEGPMMSIKSVNAVSHYTDWTIGHVHAGTLGWNSFLSFGILYWIVPRLWKTELFSKKLATAHFWIGTIGLILYQVSMWVAGITQWAMWRAFEPDGRLVYPDFIETVLRIVPMYWVRLVGALLFFAGLLVMLYNLVRTMRSAPAGFDEEPEVKAPPLVVDRSAPGATTAPGTWDHAFYRFQHVIRHGVHRAIEGRVVLLTVMTALALSVGSLVEAIPLFFDESNVKTIASVKPYTPLELLGRDIYVREGCYNCHSQMVRPFRHETERYGEYSKAGEFVYDHPFQWGSKRTGPDLHRVGAKYPSLWHVRHMDQPRSTTPGSVMPRYPHLLKDPIDDSLVEAKMRAMRTVGVPYSDGEIATAKAAIAAQAQAIASEVEAQQGPPGLADREITALTAYLQRLGTDIRWRRPEVQPPLALPAAPAAASVPAAAPVAAAR
ncbi:MAG TPA: cytochrome-c oxidase, cbb3-type subunit I [Thermoanaerobaculia bacterium]|nr:cytochrome-c oxidase, cbb3-type subunit I [Thermoanaerobaculia bacterium]HQN07100.1 cytochrome-c oxidase, cbb3-type subunit I [Thermoanaerobaculia bacterium]HQP86336.1 cytochrome-c oxidase, cbb3-type subunit I [Thermoanaerobaculia bacterium]